jgi:hypothetical protein
MALILSAIFLVSTAITIRIVHRLWTTRGVPDVPTAVESVVN